MNDLKQTLAKVQTQKRSPKPSRRLVGGHFSPEVAQQVRIMAASQDITIHALLAEALNDLFEKHGHSRIAE